MANIRTYIANHEPFVSLKLIRSTLSFRGFLAIMFCMIVIVFAPSRADAHAGHGALAASSVMSEPTEPDTTDYIVKAAIRSELRYVQTPAVALMQ